MTLSTMVSTAVSTDRVSEARMLRQWTFFVPGLSLLFVALIVTLPWGLPQEMTYVPPLLILAAIFCWTIRHPGLMPALLVFLVGIGVDVVTASPVGFWSFLFLIGYAVGLHVENWKLPWPTLVTALMFVPTAALVGALAWAIASAYFGQLIDWQPAARSVAIVVAFCPVLAIATRSLHLRMTKPVSGTTLSKGMA